MDKKNKCDNYKAFFIFKNEEDFYEHLKNCPECKREHDKCLKLSKLIKETAGAYFEKQHKYKKLLMTKIACCFLFIVLISGFTGYKIYDNCSFRIDSVDDSYISTLGLPIDDYGFLEL